MSFTPDSNLQQQPYKNLKTRIINKNNLKDKYLEKLVVLLSV